MDDNPRKTIAEAFAKLDQSILPSDAYEFANTELKDVWQAVRDVESAQRRRQSAQNLGRIEPFLRGLEKYAKVVEVLCNGTPYLPYVWAPIKLMVQLASEHRDVFEALLTAYADIGKVLPRFDRYERAFGHSLAFKNVLATVYSGIIEFHQRAYKFFRRRAWHVLFLSLWTDFKARFAGIIDGLKKQQDFVDKEAASIDMLESRESRDRAQRDSEQRQKDSLLLIETNEAILKSLQLEQSKSWLSIKEQDQDTRFGGLHNRRHDGTCLWIMKQAQIVSWMREDTENPILWLCGKPGAGKSVMYSYLVSTLSEVQDLDVIPYFCSIEDGDNSCSLVLRNIAFQLLSRHQDLASLISNEFISKGAGCVMSQLRILIPKILETTSFVRVVIDGLDEISVESQKSILKEVQLLCLGSTTNCKILFSSRKEVHLAQKLANKPRILLDDLDEVNSDIRLYISHIIKKLRTSSQSLLNKIESILVDKANGMFLWVRLVEKELYSCYSDWDLEERVTSLPRGLEKAYGRILARIANECGADLALRTLEWMACSYRPLKVYELLDGISFRVVSTSFDLRSKMEKDVLNLCQPLIEDVDQPSDTLKFIHFSAKEYILNGGSEDGSPLVKSSDAHFSIGFSCVAYLNTAGCLLPSCSNAQQRASLLVTGLHSLLPYANRFWIDHLLTYCAGLKGDKATIQQAFLTQLEALVQFLKPGTTLAQIEEVANTSNIEGLKTLHQLPKLRILVLSVLKFRRDFMTAVDAGDVEKSTEELSVQRSETDPSNFGILLHHYQASLESLLDQEAANTYPEISQGSLDTFQKTFGAGAFVCRYSQCSRATEGFNTSKHRDAHELTHQRQFRCKFSSCAYFSIGFATTKSLNRHNDQYHHTLVVDHDLSDLISMHRQRLSSITTPAHVPPTSLSSTTDPSSTAIDQRLKQKIFYEIGDEVAFKRKIPGSKPEEVDWIQSEVVRVMGEGKSRRYDVKDIDPDAIGGNNIYKSSASRMVPIPPEGSLLGDYEPGKKVLALYPATTTFYRAQVKSIVDGGARVVVMFEEEDNEKSIARRFVLDNKG